MPVCLWWFQLVTSLRSSVDQPSLPERLADHFLAMNNKDVHKAAEQVPIAVVLVYWYERTNSNSASLLVWAAPQRNGRRESTSSP